MKRLSWRQLIAGASGGAAGLVYYLLVGCNSSWAWQSNPVSITAIGVVLGLLMVGGRRPSRWSVGLRRRVGLLVPDDDAKTWLQVRGIGRVVGGFFSCLTPQGTVDFVVTQRPTAVPRYDDQIRARIRGWRYAPFLVDGRPAPVCTHMTVIYSQR